MCGIKTEMGGHTSPIIVMMLVSWGCWGLKRAGHHSNTCCWQYSWLQKRITQAKQCIVRILHGRYRPVANISSSVQASKLPL